MTTLPVALPDRRGTGRRRRGPGWGCGRPPRRGPAGPGRRAATSRRLRGSSRDGRDSGIGADGRDPMRSRGVRRARPRDRGTGAGAAGAVLPWPDGASRRSARASRWSGTRAGRRASARMPRMAHRVTLIPGDGIGPELAEATRRVLDASGVAFDWEVQDAGEGVMAQYGTPLPDHVLESIRRNKVALKGPITTPVGSGFRSVNVTLRQALGLYANLRPARSIKGLETRYEDVDLVIVRENTEDLYAGIEHMVGQDAAESIKIITRAASERIARFAFEYAVANGRQQGHGGPQGQHHEAVRRPVPRELPDGRGRVRGQGRVRGPDRRQHVHAARPEARAVRRAGAAEPVRRHRQRPVRRASSAASASRPAPTSGSRRPSSSRSTARRPSTPA